MDREYNMFFKNDDKSYTIVDLYLNDRFLGYKSSYNQYDIDLDKILISRKSDNEYIVRFNDVNNMKIVPLQLKINNFYFGELHMSMSNNTVVSIPSDDKELFRKYREVQNKIIELTSINNAPDFIETTLYDDEDEFIMVDVEKNTSCVRDSYRNELVIVLHSVFHDYPRISLVQYRY